MKTFLEIVNDAIAESKVTLDPLTSADFANPPRTIMYNNFKRWVNIAYKEALLRRNELYSRKERALVRVWPRIHVTGLTYLPVAGDVWVAQNSGVTIEVKGVHIFEDVEDDATVERTLSVEFLNGTSPNNLQMGEAFDITSPSVATGVGTYKGAGFYRFEDLVTNLSEIDMDTVRVYNEESVETGYPVAAVNWEAWDPNYSYYPWVSGVPMYITKNRQGAYMLYPMIQEDVQLSFYFSKKIPRLVDYDDVPVELPEDYDDYLMWRAVEEYADYNADTRIYARAHKHVEQYINWLDRDHKPLPSMDLYRFDAGGNYRRQPRG